MVYFEHEITAKEERDRRKFWSKIVFYGFTLLLFFAVYSAFSSRGFEFDVGMIIVVWFIAAGYSQMKDNHEFDDSDGKWHLYVDHEKIYLLKPDDTERQINFSDIASVDHIIDTFPDDTEHCCYVITKQENAISLSLPLTNFYKEKLVNAFKKLGFKVREFKGHRESEYRDEANRLGFEVINLVDSENHLI